MMSKRDGTYTEHLAGIYELLARLDERTMGTAEDVAEIKARLKELNGTVDRHGEAIAVLTSRQKVMGGALGLVGGGVLTFVLEWLLR